MGQEIERKFLVLDESWRAGAGPGRALRQGYLLNEAGRSLRIRVAGDQAWLTIKAGTSTLARAEYEYGIPVQDAAELLSLCQEPPLAKIRYEVPCAGHLWEVDVFEGANAGLIVAELELTRPDEPFSRPPWLGAEVTDDPRYLNSRLIREPYTGWRDRR